MVLKKLPWLDIAALGGATALVLVSNGDPLVIFRLLLLVWVVVHVFLTLQRFYEDIVGVREFLVDLEGANPAMRGVAETGRRVFVASFGLIARRALRSGWPTLLLALLVVAANAATWVLLTKPDLLKAPPLPW